MVSFLAAAGSVQAGSVTTVYFNSASQGGSGNFGEYFAPVDDHGLSAHLMMSARASITPFDLFDPFAAGQVGTLNLATEGAGVQDVFGGGSARISGLNNDGIEEVMLTFDRPVPTDALFLTIKSYSEGSGHGSKDDTVVFVFLVGGDVVAFDEYTGIVDGPSGLGSLNIGALLDPGVLVAGIAIRETRSHIILESLTFTATIPSPGALALLGTAGILGVRRRRRTA